MDDMDRNAELSQLRRDVDAFKRTVAHQRETIEQLQKAVACLTAPCDVIDQLIEQAHNPNPGLTALRKVLAGRQT